MAPSPNSCCTRSGGRLPHVRNTHSASSPLICSRDIERRPHHSTPAARRPAANGRRGSPFLSRDVPGRWHAVSLCDLRGRSSARLGAGASSSGRRNGHRRSGVAGGYASSRTFVEDSKHTLKAPWTAEHRCAFASAIAAGRSQESACPESIESMDDKRTLLMHFLGTLAYRTQKALRDAPADFGQFRAADAVRTPSELVRHMTSVLGYARACDEADIRARRFGGARGRGQPVSRHAPGSRPPYRRGNRAPRRHDAGAIAAGAAGRCHDTRRATGDAPAPGGFARATRRSSLADIQGTRLGPDQADPVDRTMTGPRRRRSASRLRSGLRPLRTGRPLSTSTTPRSRAQANRR